MKGKTFFLLLAAILLIIGLAACSKENRVQSPLAPSNPLKETKASADQTMGTQCTGGGQAGTTLSAEKTATGFWERTTYKYYDWTIDKSVNPTQINICSGQTGSVNYTISVTRILTSSSSEDVYGVRGEITVHNGGAVATENLKLVDQVEYKTGAGQFQPLPDASQTIIPSTQLGPGETGTYNYEITFQPVANATYRNTVKVTITNHSGHLGEEFGPEPKADFSIPPTYTETIIEEDETATIEDNQTCPNGFTCIASDPGPWTFNDSGTVTFSKSVQNVSAACDSYFYLNNIASLTEGDSGATRNDSASVEIYTCQCPTGCTLTIGFWKTHAGFHGKNPDRVSPYLPIWLGTAGGAKSVQVTTAAQAVEILSFSGNASNGINKLYAQLLAAKLNIANGADGSAIAATIAAADAFLANNSSSDWSSLSKAQQKQVLNWMTTLDNYNNGYIGPGHCD